MNGRRLYVIDNNEVVGLTTPLILQFNEFQRQEALRFGIWERDCWKWKRIHQSPPSQSGARWRKGEFGVLRKRFIHELLRMEYRPQERPS